MRIIPCSFLLLNTFGNFTVFYAKIPIGVSLDIENYCTLRLFFNHLDVRKPLSERIFVS